jgi:PAS domain S-box-containing protein
MLPAVLERWKASIATGEPFDMIFPLLGADGVFHPFLTRVMPVKNAEGNVVRWFGTNTDITAQKSVEQELRKSEERYRSLFTAMNEGFCVVEMIFDAEGKPVDYRFLEVNAAFEKQTGMHDAVGKRMREFAPDHEDNWFEIYGRIALTGEPAHFVNEAKALDRYYDVHAYRVGDPELRRVAIVFNDFSEYKRAEEAREKLAAIVDSSQDSIIGLSVDGIITSWNRSAERLFGYSAEEAIGQSINLVIPPERFSEEEAILARLCRGESLDHFETARLDKSGRTIDVSLTISPIYNASGTIVGISKSVRDVTEQKQAEAEVRKSRDLLEMFVENAPAGLAMFDRNMRYVRASRKWHQEAGLEPVDINGKTHYDVFPNLPEHWKELHRRGLAGESLRDEEAWIAADGSLRTINWAIHPWGDSGTETGGIIIFTEDVTEREKVQEELRRSQERLSTIVDSAMDAIITLDANQRIVVFNPAAEQIFECPLAEALGKPVDRFIPADLRQAHHAHVEGFNRTGVTVRSMHSPATLFGLRANGEPFPLEATISRGEIGGEQLFTVILRDITERKQAEEALRASEERWATTLQSIGDAVISTDAAGRIDFMNEIAQKLTGWPLQEALGKHLPEVFDIVHEATRIKPESPVAKVIRSGKIVGLANHTLLIRRDGAEFPIEDSAAPIRDKQGDIEGVVLVFHDASEQRKMEKVLRSNERLATTGRLAATIAHEIHNPLDAVGNLLYLIGHGTKEDSTRELISEAARELVRVTQMTQQMLSFQREAAKPIPVNIGDILNSVVTLYERKINAAGIRLRTQFDVDGYLLALPGELRQVFANLLSNAIEAIGKRTGAIALHAFQSRNWQTGQAGIRVVISDNGPGIPAKVCDKIFEPFFTTKGEGGTGLGLWITSDILHKYQGTIKVRTNTQPGLSGTHFSVFFPSEIEPELPPELSPELSPKS